MKYCVTVIIPMYNRAHIIGRALDAVFRQTLEGIEVIVIDDGSTDKSIDIVKKYQEDKSNILLFEVPHGGPGLARNVGIKNAHGKYISFLDSDDFVPERAYQLLYETAEEGEFDFVVGQILRKIDTFQNGRWFVPEKISQVLRSYVGKNCAQGYDIAIANPSLCNRMIRRDIILENKLLFGGEVFGEDFIYNLNLFRCANRATVIDEIVYCYETNYSTASSTISTMELEMVLSGLKSIRKAALYFDAIGRIDWEIDTLLGPFEFVLQRFFRLPFSDRIIAFEEVKKYLRNYRNRREYELTINNLMGMDLGILLSLSYPVYEIRRKYKKGY